MTNSVEVPAVMPTPIPTPIILINLAQQARKAESDKALQFLLVNQTHQLVPYLLGMLWIEDEGVVLQSGVSFVERNSPYIMWLNSICLKLIELPACEVLPEMLDDAQIEEWETYLPANAYWLPISGGKRKAGLLLARESEFTETELPYLKEWVDTWSYSWNRMDAPTVYGELTRIWIRFQEYVPTWGNVKSYVSDVARGVKIVYEDYRHNPKKIILRTRQFFLGSIEWIKTSWQWLRAQGFEGAREALIHESKAIWRNKKRRWTWLIWIFLLFPVRLTVLVPGELVPANPAIIRVPIEGVVDEFFVTPNQEVAKGQPLFNLDLTSLLSRLHVAEQETQIATQEYRQSSLQGLTDAKSRGMLVPQEGRAAEKKIEADYLKELINKAKINAPRQGIVLFDDPSEWIGKPVQAGEKVMVVATEGDVEIEGWIPVGEAIDLPKDSSVILYLNAMPFSPVTGSLRYAGHEPIQRPDGGYAYRVRASLTSGEKGPRVGLKGTAKVHGQFVPLSYWVLRRPLSTLRQFLGI
jgi:hypothetical protein